MKSNITLNIESGATLRFSDHFEDYLPFVRIRWEGTVMNTLSPLIYADGADNLTITGRGTLDGNGFKWWSWESDTKKTLKENGGKLPSLTKLQQMWVDANKDLEVSEYYKPSLERRMFRPPFIQFFECTNIVIENVKIINSPFWTINPAFCDNITVHGVTIKNPSANPKRTVSILPLAAMYVSLIVLLVWEMIVLPLNRDAMQMDVSTEDLVKI